MATKKTTTKRSTAKAKVAKKKSVAASTPAEAPTLVFVASLFAALCVVFAAVAVWRYGV